MDDASSESSCGSPPQHSSPDIQPSEEASAEDDATCYVCHKIFSNRKYLKQHMTVHAGVDAFNCATCCKSFKKKSSLLVHQKLHTGKGLHTCAVCRKVFTLKSNYNEHVLTHGAAMNYRCELCDKKFKTRPALCVHVKRHTRIKSYVCDFCDKRFGVLSGLTRHLTVHSEYRAYPCLSCPKVFKTTESLSLHVKLHTGQQLYYCDRCDKAFAAPSHLKEHMHVHTDGKPYRCDVCMKEYKFRRNLREHMKYHPDMTGDFPEAHSDDSQPATPLFDPNQILQIKMEDPQQSDQPDSSKPFKCIMCFKRFDTQKNLHIHLKTAHTINGLYTCPVCKKQFTRPGSFRQHVPTHSKASNVTYQCPFCERTFKVQNAFSKHVKSHENSHQECQKRLHLANDESEKDDEARNDKRAAQAQSTSGEERRKPHEVMIKTEGFDSYGEEVDIKKESDSSDSESDD